MNKTTIKVFVPGTSKNRSISLPASKKKNPPQFQQFYILSLPWGLYFAPHSF